MRKNVNRHMVHLEDVTLYGDIVDAINIAMRMRWQIFGIDPDKYSLNVTTKWDGAPAIFAGTDPADGKFFVATKRIFNAQPVVYKTAEEIDRLVDNEGLRHKLHIALEELPKLGINGILQGDVMFTDDIPPTDVCINGTDYLTFQPNTLIYAVPSKSREADTIRKARIGIVFHTAYDGDDLRTITPRYGITHEDFGQIQTVWAKAATMESRESEMHETEIAAREISGIIKEIYSLHSDTLSILSQELQSDRKTAVLIETYLNSQLKKGSRTSTIDGFAAWMRERTQKEADKLLTERGRKAKLEAAEATIQFVQFLIDAKVFVIRDLISKLKMVLIDYFNFANASGVNTFVLVNGEYHQTTHEGYVIYDPQTHRTYKLVDRTEFTRLNFSPNIQKGWS